MRGVHSEQERCRESETGFTSLRHLCSRYRVFSRSWRFPESMNLRVSEMRPIRLGFAAFRVANSRAYMGISLCAVVFEV
jgi:hypothetical protein